MMQQQRVSVLLAALAVVLAACGGADGAALEDAATEPAADTEPVEATTEPEPMTAPETAAATDTAEPTEPAATGTPDAAAGATVAISDSDLGEILVDGEGRALYLLTADSPGESTCTDACATAWPPFTATGEPQAGEGADAALLGTIEREDGTMQVTYGDHPLYYFQGDAGPGEVNGQGIESFGGVWWVVAPSGEAITGEEAAAAGDGGY